MSHQLHHCRQQHHRQRPEDRQVHLHHQEPAASAGTNITDRIIRNLCIVGLVFTSTFTQILRLLPNCPLPRLRKYAESTTLR